MGLALKNPRRLICHRNNKQTNNQTNHSAGAVEYTNCIFAERLDPRLDMTPSCIWWWGCRSGVRGNVKYPFVTLTPWSTLTWAVVLARVSSMLRSKTKRGFLGITLNCMRWWDSGSGTQGNAEYPFITITPKKWAQTCVKMLSSKIVYIYIYICVCVCVCVCVWSGVIVFLGFNLCVK